MDDTIKQEICIAEFVKRFHKKEKLTSYQHFEKIAAQSKNNTWLCSEQINFYFLLEDNFIAQQWKINFLIIRPYRVIFGLFFNENGVVKWKEHISRVIEKERTSMDSARGWKLKTEEQFYLEEDQKEEKS